MVLFLAGQNVSAVSGERYKYITFDGFGQTVCASLLSTATS
jgi:hypothetical protein